MQKQRHLSSSEWETNQLLYREPLALTVDAQEVLQLVQFCEDAKNSICISDRHKEIFSLIHLLYIFITKMQTPISLNDAFQLHMAKCNGFMIDRMEMLFLMNFLLSWAEKARVIPSKLQQKSSLWRDTYGQMAVFRSTHPNVVTIHPDHLTDLSEDVVMDIARAGGFPPPRFSYRNETVMSDKFVCRWNIVGGEVDLGRRARMEAMRIKSNGNENIRKEEIDETGTMGEGQDEDMFMYVNRRYRGNFQELLEAERRQIEDLKRKRGKTDSSVPRTPTAESVESKDHPLATSTSRYPSQEPILGEDLAKPMRRPRRTRRRFKLTQQEKAIDFISEGRPATTEGFFVKIKKLFARKFASRKQSSFRISSRKSSKSNKPLAATTPRTIKLSKDNLSQDLNAPKISSNETASTNPKTSAESQPQVSNTSISPDVRKPPVWTKSDETTDQKKSSEEPIPKPASRRPIASSPARFGKDLKAPPVWRKATSTPAPSSSKEK